MSLHQCPCEYCNSSVTSNLHDDVIKLPVYICFNEKVNGQKVHVPYILERCHTHMKTRNAQRDNECRDEDADVPSETLIRSLDGKIFTSFEEVVSQFYNSTQNARGHFMVKVRSGIDIWNIKFGEVKRFVEGGALVRLSDVAQKQEQSVAIEKAKDVDKARKMKARLIATSDDASRDKKAEQESEEKTDESTTSLDEYKKISWDRYRQSRTFLDESWDTLNDDQMKQYILHESYQVHGPRVFPKMVRIGPIEKRLHSSVYYCVLSNNCGDAYGIWLSTVVLYAVPEYVQCMQQFHKERKKSIEFGEDTATESVAKVARLV